MYVPSVDKIKTAGPRTGMFYRRGSSSSVTVANIARVAAEHAPAAISIANMVVLIANSPWNRAHIRYASTGYESYSAWLIYKDSQGRGMGPQMEKMYAPDPTAGHGTGSGWPTFWVPTVDGKEPHQVYGGTIGIVSPILPEPDKGGGRSLGTGGEASTGERTSSSGGGDRSGASPDYQMAGAGSKWWMWAIAGVALIGAYFAFGRKGKKRSKKRKR